MKRSPIVLLTVSLFACDGGGSPAVGTDGSSSSGAAVESSSGGQAETSTTAVPDDSDATGNWWQSTGEVTFTGGAEGGTFGDTEGEFEEPETFAEWFGDGTIEPGMSYEGMVEFIAVNEGVEQCLMFFTPSDITWVDTCTECEFAFVYTLSEMEAKVSEGCDAVGVDPATIQGSTQAVGVNGKQLYRQLNGVWVPNGEGEYLAGKGVLTYSFSAE